MYIVIYNNSSVIMDILYNVYIFYNKVYKLYNNLYGEKPVYNELLYNLYNLL